MHAGAAVVAGGRVASLTTLPPMQQPLRVDTAGLQAMVARWAASVGELSGTAAPAGLGSSCQASAAAIDAAHANVTAFTAALTARVGARATRVAEADTRYIGNETHSANVLAAIAHPVIGL